MIEPDDSLILLPSRRKYAGMLLGSLAFVAIGLAIIGEGHMTGWLVVGFFALCAAAFLVNILPQASYLKLTVDNFEYVALFRKTQLQWTSVSSFGVTRVDGRAMVMFDILDQQTAAAALARRLLGAGAGLPDTYGLNAEELAQLMNDWRERSLVWKSKKT